MESFVMNAQPVKALIEYLNKLPPDMDATCNDSCYFFGVIDYEHNEVNFTDELPKEE